MSQSETTTNQSNGCEYDRHDIELRDVRDGQLVVSYNRVRTNRTMVEAIHVSDRLPLATLALFDGPTADIEALTADERAWIEAEARAIAFEGVA